MKFNPWVVGIVLGIIILTGAFLLTQNTTPTELAVAPRAPLRLGWMTSWADGGFLVEALKNTEIPKENNASMEFFPVSYGPPLLEAALANKIDAMFVGWVPAVNLLAKTDEWIVIGRLADWRGYVIVEPDSTISTISDLKRKKIGVPYGSGLYPALIMQLRDAGLVIGEEVELVNIQPTELPVALKTKQVDAVAWLEPMYTTLLKSNSGKAISKFNDTSFIMVSKKYAKENPQQIRNFIQSIKHANVFVSQNKQQVFQWYAKDSGFDLSLVESLDIIEPNYNVQSADEVSLTISPEMMVEIQTKIDFEYQEKIISKQVILAEHVDLNFLN